MTSTPLAAPDKLLTDIKLPNELKEKEQYARDLEDDLGEVRELFCRRENCHHYACCQADLTCVLLKIFTYFLPCSLKTKPKKKTKVTGSEIMGMRMRKEAQENGQRQEQKMMITAAMSTRMHVPMMMM